ncbi:MAG TPA: hypothetical protein VFA38_05715 [Nitrospirales bacterium]|nr:hypothetical protein [Nitrospirales bacterium]
MVRPGATTADAHGLKTFEHRCRPIPPTGAIQLLARPSGPPMTAAQLAQLSAETGFSEQSLRVAQSIGAVDLLQKIQALEHEAGADRHAADRLERIRTELSDRILLGLLQVSGMESEMMCEAERADQLGDRLELADEDRGRLLTIIAIIAGGIGGVVGGAIAITGDIVISGVMGVVTGAAATGVSALALKQDRHMTFKHSRNLLRDVWEGPTESQAFPQLVWRFLNGPLEEDPKMTVREAVVWRWRRDGHLGTPGSPLEQRRIELLFGNGGEYLIDDLRARAQMLEMLQGQVGLMNQYLERFLGEVLSKSRVNE